MLNTRTARRYLLDDDNHSMVCGTISSVEHECVVKDIVRSAQKETLEYIQSMLAVVPWKHREDGAVLVYLDDVDVVLERALDIVSSDKLGRA